MSNILNDARYKSVSAYFEAKARLGIEPQVTANDYDAKAEKVYDNVAAMNTKTLESQLAKLNQVEEPAVQQAATTGLAPTTKTNDNYLVDGIKREHATGGEILGDTAISIGEGLAGAWSTIGKTSVTLGIPLRRIKEYITDEDALTVQQALSEMDNKLGVTTLNNWFQSKKSEVNQNKLAEISRIENDPTMDEVQKGLATTKYYAENPDMAGYGIITSLVRSIAEIKGVGKVMGNVGTTGQKAALGMGVSGQAGYLTNAQQNGTASDETLVNSLIAGAGTAALGAAAHKLIGGTDIDRLGLNGLTSGQKGISNWLRGGVQEFTEEVPQGAMGTALDNYENNRPIKTDMGKTLADSAVMGFGSGLVGGAPSLVANGAQASINSTNKKLTERDVKKNGTAQENVDPTNDKFNPTRAYKSALYDLNSSDPIARQEASKLLATATSVSYEQLADFDAQIAATTNETTKKDLIAKRTKFENEKLAPLKAEVNAYINQSIQNKDNFMAIMTNYALEKSQREQEEAAKPSTIDGYDAQALKQLTEIRDAQGDIIPTGLTIGQNIGEGIAVQASSNAGQFQGLISAKSKQYGVPATLINAIVQTESEFNPNAKSGAGAVGLMQLMPGTAKDLKVTDRANPEQNIDGGVRYIGQLLKRYNGDMNNALMAYNWGMGNVDAYLKTGKGAKGQAIPKETTDYLRKIKGAVNAFSNGGQPTDTTQNRGKPLEGKLKGTDARISEVVMQAAKNLGIKLGVSEGLRSVEAQKKNVANGKSQTMNSKHLHGGAVDFHIIGADGKANWDFEAYRPLAEEAKRIAAEKGYEGFEWGGDWKTLKDGVHFQFKEGSENVNSSVSEGTEVQPQAKEADASITVAPIPVNEDTDEQLTNKSAKEETEQKAEVVTDTNTPIGDGQIEVPSTEQDKPKTVDAAVSELRAERQATSEELAKTAANPQVRAQEVSEASKQHPLTRQYGRGNELNLYGENGKGNPIYTDSEGKRYTVESGLTIMQSSPNALTSPTFEGETFKTKSEYDRDKAAEFVDAPIPWSQMQEIKASVQTPESIFEEDAMRQTRAFFSSMSEEEIDAHPLLAPEQKIALKQLSAFKRQLADTQTTDTVREQIIKGYKGKDNRDSHIGLEQYDTILNQAIASNDKGTASTYLGYLQRFTNNSVSKSEAIEQAILDGATKESPVYLSVDTKGIWQPVSKEQFQEAKSSNGSTFEVIGNNKGTRNVAEEAKFLTTALNTFTASTQALLGNDVVPITPSETPVATSQSNSSKSSSVVAKKPVPTESEQSDGTKTGFKALTRVENYSEVPTDAEYLGRATVDGKTTSMGNIKSADDIGNPGWLGNPHNDATPAKSMEKYIGSLKENAAKYPEFVKALIETKGKALYGNTRASKRSEVGLLTEMLPQLPNNYRDALDYINRIESYNPDTGIKLLDKAPTPPKAEEPAAPVRTRYDVDAVKERSAIPDPKGKSKAKSKGKAAKPVSTTNARTEISVNTAQETDSYVNSYSGNNGQGVASTVTIKRDKKTHKLIEVTYAVEGGKQSKTFTLKDKTVSDELLMSTLEKKLGAEEEFVQINLNNQDEETTQEYEGRVIPNELANKTVNLEEAMKLYADDIEAETVEPQERALYKALISTLLNFNPKMKVLISQGTQENGFDEDTNTIRINLPMTEGNILQEIARIVVGSTTGKVAGELELLGSTDMVVDLNKLYDLNQDLSKLKRHVDTIIRADDSRYTKFSDDVKIKILNAMKSNASLFEMATTDMDIMKFLQGIEVPKSKVKQSVFAKIVSSLKSFLNIGSNNQVNNQFDKLLELTVRAASEQSRNLSVDFKASDDAKVHTFRGMDNNSLEIAQQVELKKNFYERNQLLAVFKQSAAKGKPLTRIANLTDKLKLDLMQGLQSLVSEAPTKVQREQIEDFLVFRDEMAEHILQTFRKKQPSYLKDKEGNPILDDEGNLTYSPTDFGFQDLKTYFMDNNGDIDNNVVTSVALAAYDWVVENGNKTQNMDKDIKKLLNLDPDDIAFLSPEVRELYQFRGGLRPYATAKIGKKAVEVLGIKATENASAEAQSRLENSIGEWAISAMQSADLVHITSIPSEQHKANIEEVGGDLTNFSTVDNGLGQVSFLSVTNPEGLDVNPRLYEVFMKNKGTVGYMGEVFGTEIGLRAPLKSAPTKTIDKIKRTISTMSLDQRKYVEKMQAEPISINVDMSNGLQNLLASDRDTTLEMIGAKVTDETLANKHKLERHSLESAAEGVFRDLENGLDFINSLPKLASNKLQEFFDYVYAAKNNRMHYASNMFNFQSSKLQRSLGEYSNFENTLDISVVADNNIAVLDENNQVTGAAYFIRAVAESAEGTEDIIKAKLEGKNFVDGFTVDKIDSINFIDPFYQYLRSDVDVQSAVKATTKLLGGNKLTSAEVKSIAKVVKFWEGEANSLRALIEYTKFQNAVDNGDTEFTTSLGLGSDGINNGSAISYMQMGVGNDKFFTQVGMLPEDGVFGGMSNYFQTRTNPEIGDYYTGFEPHIREAFGELTDKQAAILELNTNFFKRKSFKAVLIPFGYSAGMPRLKALVYGQFMSDIMGQLVKVGNMDATTQEAKDARQALENKLNRVLTTPVTLPEGKALLEFWFEFKQENELKRAYESEIGDGVVEALEAYAAPFMAARNRNVKIQEAAYKTYNTLKNIIKEETDKAYVGYLAKQDKYKDLTEAQLTKLMKVEGIPKAYYDKHIKHRYDAIRPTVKTPFNKDSTDWFDDSDFSIPQQVNTLKADPTSQSNTWKVNAKQEYVGSTVSVPKSVTEEESSGVMVNSAQVQGTDAKISARASAFGGNVNINVHDANISGLLNYIKMGLEQNKATYESLRDYHAQSYSLLALSETVGHALNMYKDGTLSEEVLTDILFNAINDIYGNDAIVEYQEANKIAEELSDADMLEKMVKPFIAQLLEDTKATENAKLDNLSRIGVMHQYGGEGAEYVVTATDKAEIEVQRKEIDKLYKDIAENMGTALGTSDTNRKIIDAYGLVKLNKHNSSVPDWALQKDQDKSDEATKYIGFGAPNTSTNQYAKDWGEDANSGIYVKDDIVFVSSNGLRKNRISVNAPNSPYRAEIKKAVDAGAYIVMDNAKTRSSKFNVGEREAMELLKEFGYAERKFGSGVWSPKAQDTGTPPKGKVSREDVIARGWNKNPLKGVPNVEVSSKGDKRFSALFAVLKNGYSVEEMYQLFVKGYAETEAGKAYLKNRTGSIPGKGKAPVVDMTEEETYAGYKGMWSRYLNENPELLKELQDIRASGAILTDSFATTLNNQARALAELASEMEAPKIVDEDIKVETKDFNKILGKGIIVTLDPKDKALNDPKKSVTENRALDSKIHAYADLKLHKDTINRDFKNKENKEMMLEALDKLNRFEKLNISIPLYEFRNLKNLKEYINLWTEAVDAITKAIESEYGITLEVENFIDMEMLNGLNKTQPSSDTGGTSQIVLKPISEAMASIENMLTDPNNNITEQKAALFNYIKGRIKAHEKESGRVIRTAVTDKLNKGERGRFDVATSTIFMSKDYLKNGNPDQQLELLLHEMMHALTAVTIATSKDADVRKAVGTLETMRKQLQAKAKKEGNKYYANVVFASVDEFVAYGMTDAAVMQYMNDTFNSEVSNTPTIKFSSRVKSGALKFLKSVFTLFGGKSTEYENFLRSVDVITASYTDAQLSDYNGAISMYSTAPTGTDALRQLSSLNVSTEHNNHLNSIIDTTITKFLEVNTAKTDLVDRVMSKVNTRAINAGFKMSDKELHVNEIVKEIAKTFLTENSGTKAASDIRAAYTRASKEVTVDMFLNDPSTATPAERKQAQKQYNYLFKANNPEPVERFLALTIASEEVQKVMAKLDNIKTVKEETTWFGKLMEFFTNMMRWLSGRVLNTNGLNIPTELDVLFERLGNINKSAKTNHVNMFDKGYAFTTRLVTVPANFVVTKLMDAIFGVFNFGAASSNPTIRAASSAIVGMRETGIGAVADSYLGLQTRATTNDASGRLNGLGEIIYEMGRNKGMKQVVESLIRMTTKANQNRQLATSKAKDALIKVFTDIDNVPKSQLDAVTQVALRTDASALMRHGTSITQVIGLLRDTGKRKKMIAKLEAQIATHRYSNDVLLQTKALGHYMATEVAPEHLVKNAEGIAIGKGSWYETDIASMDTALRDTIDQLASLYAMEATSKEAQSQLNTLIAEQPEAVKALLNHHLEMVNRSMQDFKDNMPNYSKGYMPQKTNDLRSLKFAEDDLEVTKLEAQGWEKVSDGDIRQDISDNTDGRTLMFHNDMLYRDYVSGALDMKDTHAKGTMVYMVGDNLAEVNRVSAEKLASRRRRSQTNHKQFNFSKQAEGNLIASYNAAGELTGYHYEMSGRLRDTYLERDNNAIELLGRYHSNLGFKPEVAKVQRTIAQELYQDFKNSYGNDPRQFVTLDPESKDPNVVMMWRMMPYEFRAEASRLFGKGMPIVVRSTVYNTVFGFRTYSMSEMFDKVTGEKNMLEVFLTGVLQAIFGDKAQMRTLQGERLWQKGISQIKDFIVIRNYKVLVGNIVSNALLLSLQGVSPTQQIKDFISVWNNGGKYRELAARVVEIDNEIAINRNRPKEISKLKRERNLAMIEMERNPLHDFMEEGLMSSIVEDTDLYAEDSGYKSELDKKIEEYTGNIPKQVVTAFNWAVMSPGTPMHNFMAHSTQFSDLAAKYSLTKHRMSKGDSKADAIAEAQDAFINYDIPTGKGLDYLNKMGLFMFTKFVLRFQQAIMKQLSTRAGSAITQHLMVEELTNQAGVLEPFMLNRLGNPFSAGMLNYGSAFNNISTVSFMKGLID